MEPAGLGAIVDRDRQHDGQRYGLRDDEQPERAARPEQGSPWLAADRDDVVVCVTIGHLIIAGG
jgi:hypothetical protein